VVFAAFVSKRREMTLGAISLNHPGCTWVLPGSASSKGCQSRGRPEQLGAQGGSKNAPDLHSWLYGSNNFGRSLTTGSDAGKT
jgi:hypothetical protein